MVGIRKSIGMGKGHTMRKRRRGKW